MAITINAITNTTPNTKVVLRLTCQEQWAKTQEMAYTRVSSYNRETNNLELLSFYNIRARRIAATYAKLYLEEEAFGDKSKIGRYYWMALGAFAVKTVVYLLEDIKSTAKNDTQVNNNSTAAKTVHTYAGIAKYLTLNPALSLAIKGVEVLTADLPTIINATTAFAKGNLWLFMDIAPWHWMYSISPSEWNKCQPVRDACNYPVPVVDDALKNYLPWGKEVLPKINCLKVTAPLLKGFSYIPTIEALSGKTDKDSTLARGKFQLKHLIAIAIHEQHEILQKVAWEDPALKRTSELLRTFPYKLAAPEAKLVFTSYKDVEDTPDLYKVDPNRLQSYAPKDMKVEIYESRFPWIQTVANKFHAQMQQKDSRDIIERELHIIASWDKARDPT
jgi:hypothetical protein